MLGGNPLASDHGVGIQGELRAVTACHPTGTHFSIFIGETLSTYACGSPGRWHSPAGHLPSSLIFQSSKQESFTPMI